MLLCEGARLKLIDAFPKLVKCSSGRLTDHELRNLWNAVDLRGCNPATGNNYVLVDFSKDLMTSAMGLGRHDGYASHEVFLPEHIANRLNNTDWTRTTTAMLLFMRVLMQRVFQDNASCGLLRLELRNSHVHNRLNRICSVRPAFRTLCCIREIAVCCMSMSKQLGPRCV